MRIVLRLFVFAAMAATAVPAFAQSQPRDEAAALQPRRGAMRAPREPMGFRVFGFVDIESEAAKKSFKAVTGTSMLIGFGAGLELLHVGGPIFLRFAYGQASHSGERVIVFGDEVFTTGVPITVKKSPLEVGVGFRGGRPSGTAAYFGGGLLLLRYQETTTQFADESDNTNQTFTGFNAFGGIDLSMGRHFSIGLEAQYRSVPNAIGDLGISAAYGEKDLGGLGARVSFGFKK